MSPPPLPPTPLLHITLPEGSLLLKREDFQPNGSHKDRSLPLQIQYHLQQHAKGFVLSSSGNAAISAADYCKKHQIPLLLFLSPKTHAGKIRALQEREASILFCEKPINFARVASNLLQWVNLRASLDPVALSGYHRLGEELAQEQPSALFSFVSSGTSLLGCAEGLQQKGCTPALFPVQHAPDTAISAHWDTEKYPNEEFSEVSLLGVKHSPRHEQVLATVQRSQGQGIVVGASLVKETQEELEKRKIFTSFESICAVAGWRKLKQRSSFSLPSIALLTGKSWGEATPLQDLPVLQSYSQLRETLYSFGHRIL